MSRATLAGFEGGTKIDMITISLFTVREQVVSALVGMRASGRGSMAGIGD